jgi:autotransporter-associated beta strand protein
LTGNVLLTGSPTINAGPSGQSFSSVVLTIAGSLNYGGNVLTLQQGVVSLTGGAATGTGNTVVTGGVALNVSNVNELSSGNLQLNNGAYVLASDSNATAGAPTWTNFQSQYSGQYGGGQNQWQITGTGGGFAAQGTGPATILINNASNSAYGSVTSQTVFDQSWRVGADRRGNLTGASGSQVFYANAPVVIAQNTTLSGIRSISVAPTGPGEAGAAGSGVVNRFSGNLSGFGAVTFTTFDTPQGLTGLSPNEAAEFVLAGTDNWTGNPGTINNVNAGSGGLILSTNNFVRFASPSSLPTGNNGAPAFLAAIRDNTTNYVGGILLTSGFTWTLPTGYSFLLGDAVPFSGNAKTSILGASSDAGTPAVATLQNTNILITNASGTTGPFDQYLGASQTLSLLVRDGTLNLGAGGNALTFQNGTNAYFAGTNLFAGDGVLLPLSTFGFADGAASANNVRLIEKDGAGTAVLNNVAYALPVSGNSAAGGFSWSVGSSANLGGTLQLGAAGQIPVTATVSVVGSVFDLNGNNQTVAGLNMGGGPAGSTSTVNTESATLFLTGDVTYSATNNAGTATINGNLDLGGARNFNIALSTGTSTAMVVNAVITDGSLTKIGTGQLLLTGSNTYAGNTTVLNGTLLVGASGALGTSSNPVQVGDVTGSNSAALLTQGPVTVSQNITVPAGSTGTATLGGNTADSSLFTGTVTASKPLTLSAATSGSANFVGTITAPFLIENGDTGGVDLINTVNFTGTTATGTATVSAGVVTGVTGIAGGSGYTAIPTVTFSGGGGQGAAGTAVLTGGVVTSVTITNGGFGYTSAPAVAFSTPYNATITDGTLQFNSTNPLPVTTPVIFANTAGVGSVLITNGGSGYTSTPTVTFAAPSTAGGVTATGVATLSGGVVTGITMTNPGSGYTAAPSITFSVSGGSGAAATAVLIASAVLSVPAGGTNTIGSITGGGAIGGNINIGNATLVIGNDNTTPAAYAGSIQGGATAVLSKTGSGTQILSGASTFAGYFQISGGAIRTASGGALGSSLDSISVGGGTTLQVGANTGGIVSSVTVNNGGSNYSSAPAVTFTGTGTGAAATAVISGSLTAISLTGSVTAVALTQNVTSVVLTTAGAGYTSAPTIAFAGGGGSGAAATAVVSGGVVIAVNITNPGSGYTSAPILTFSGGGTTQATAVANVTLGGAGYVTAPTVTFGAAPTGGTTATGTAILTTGVTSAVISNGGSGYTSAPTVSFSGGGGSGAAATVVINGSGAVTDIIITSPGSGYTSAPSITFNNTGTGGSGAAATAIASQLVTGVNITNPGAGYTSVPTVTFTLGGTVLQASGTTTLGFGGSGYTAAPTITITGGGGTGATATATITGGIVTGISITNAGSGYSSAPIITFSAPPSGITATATSLISGSVVAVNITNPGAGYGQSPTITFSGTGGTGAAATATVTDLGPVTLSGGTIASVGGNNILANPVNVGSATAIVLADPTTATLTARSLTLSGALSGSSNIQVTAPVAAATLALVNNTVTSTYSGQVTAGTNVTLQLNGSGTGGGSISPLGTGSIVLTADPSIGSTLALRSDASTTFGNNVSVSGATGAVTLNVNQITAGVVNNVLTLGTLSASNQLNVTGGNGYTGAFGATTLNANTLLNPTSGNLILGPVSGSFALNMIGTGTATLSGAGTYTGNTTLYAGTLALGNNTALSTGTLTSVSGAVTGVTIAATAGGTGFTGSPTVTFGAPTSGTTATGTVITTMGVTSVTITNGGSGYTGNPTVIFSGGGGSGAAATATQSGGAIISFSITAFGNGYTSAPTITLVGGGGSGAIVSANITTIAIGVLLTNPGTGYTAAPTVTFTGWTTAPTGTATISNTSGTIESTPAQASITNPFTVSNSFTIGGTGNLTLGGNVTLTTSPTITVNASTTASGTAVINGSLFNVGVANGGSGYTVAPFVTFTGGGGSGATAIATVSGGVVTGVTITNAGSGYTSAPTVALTGVGTGATAVATIMGSVVNVTIATGGSGNNYTAAPTVTFSGGVGVTPATGIANLVNGVVVSVTVTSGGSGYTGAPTVTFSAPPTAVETIAGVISGAFNITESGSTAAGGTLVLSGTNTYSGTTTISIGTLIVGTNAPSGAAGALGNATSAVLVGATSGAPSSAALLTGGAFTIARAITVQSGNVGSATLGGSTADASSFTGNITLNKTATLAAATGGTATFSTGVISGSGGLTVVGPGSVVLSGANTYTGVTSVTGGTLIVGANAPSGAAGALGNATSPVSLIGPGVGSRTALLTGGAFTIGRAIVVQPGTGTITLGGNTANASTFSGTVTLSGTVIFTQVGGGTVTFSGVISGTGSALTATGAGTVILSAANTYTGGTNINNGGTIQLGVNNALPIATALVLGSGTTSGVLNLHGFSQSVGSVTTSGTGAGNTITNASPTAFLTINYNNLAFTDTYSGLITSNINLVLGGAGTVALTGTNTYTGTTHIAQGTLSISSDANLGTAPGSATPGDLIIDQTAKLTANATFTLNSNRGISVMTGIGPSGIDVTGSNILTYGGIMAGFGGAISKVDTGTLVLSGNNTYSGATTVANGTLQLGIANALPTGTALTLGSGTTSGKLDLGGFNQTVASVTMSGTGTADTVTDSGSAATFTVNPSGSNTYAGLLTGSLNLAMAGSGTLILSGTNTYTGTTTISNGVLSISSDANLGTAPASATPGDLVINGGTLQATASFTLNSNRGIALGPTSGSGTGTFDITSSNTLTYGGIAANNGGGTGSLTLTDTGTLVLAGANTYGGSTNINSGLLQDGTANALPTTTTVTLGSGTNSGTLDLNGFNQAVAGLGTSGTGSANTATNSSATAVTLTVSPTSADSYSGLITGNLALAMSGTGTLTLGGTNTYTGTTTITNGTLSISSDANLGTAPGSATPADLVINGGTLQATASFTLNSNRGIALGPSSGSGTGTIDVTSGISLTYGGIVANNGGTGSLTQVDTGTLVLSGVNTFGGSGAAVTVNGGLLSIGADSGLGNAANTLTLNGGTLQATGTFSTARTMFLGLSGGAFDVTSGNTLTTTGAIGGPGFLSLFDTGTLTLGGGSGDTTADTYGGATNVNNGTLILNKASGVNAIPGNIGIHGGTLQWNASNETPSTSTVNLTSGTLNFNNQSQTLGGLTQSGGTVTTSSSPTANNLIQFSGTIGITGGTLTVGNSTTMFTNSVLVASPGTITVQGGTGTTLGIASLTLNGATITLNFGTAGAHLLLPGSSVNTVASPTTAQILASGGSGSSPTVDMSGYSTVFTVPQGSAPNADLLITAPIVNGRIGQLGTGRLALTSTSTFTGGTFIGQGTFLVESPGSLASAGTVEVDARGVLSGNGNVGNINSVAGTVSPGIFGPGILSGGNVTFDSNTTYVATINGTTVGTQYNQLSVTGNVSLGGANLSATVGYVPTPGDSYTLITTSGGTITGTFAGLPQGQTFTLGGHTYQITYTSTAVTLTQITVGSITLTATVNPVDTTKTDATVGLSTITVNGSGAHPNALVTITTSLGLVIQGGPGNVVPPNGSTNGDADPSTAGFQVQADASGNFNFTLVSQQAGLTSITATEETGAATGNTSATFNQPLTYHVQFINETEPNPAIQQGTTPLSATTTIAGGTANPIAPYFPNTPQTGFTVGRGYGWVTAVGSGLNGSFDRGPVPPSVPGAITGLSNLQRSGAFGTAMIYAVLANPANTYTFTVYLGDWAQWHKSQQVAVATSYTGSTPNFTPVITVAQTGVDATHGGFAVMSVTLGSGGQAFALDSNGALEIQFSYTGSGSDGTDGQVNVNGFDLVDPLPDGSGSVISSIGTAPLGSGSGVATPLQVTAVPPVGVGSPVPRRPGGVTGALQPAGLPGLADFWESPGAANQGGLADLAALLSHHRVHGHSGALGSSDAAKAALDQVLGEEVFSA